jgi:hypothetical protein
MPQHCADHFTEDAAFTFSVPASSLDSGAYKVIVNGQPKHVLVDSGSWPGQRYRWPAIVNPDWRK